MQGMPGRVLSQCLLLVAMLRSGLPQLRQEHLWPGLSARSAGAFVVAGSHAV